MDHPYANKLSQFMEDTVMYNAVRAILEAQFDLNKRDFSAETVTNETLGEYTRATIEGRNLLAKGFKELNKYKQEKPRENNEVNAV